MLANAAKVFVSSFKSRCKSDTEIFKKDVKIKRPHFKINIKRIGRSTKKKRIRPILEICPVRFVLLPSSSRASGTSFN